MKRFFLTLLLGSSLLAVSAFAQSLSDAEVSRLVEQIRTVNALESHYAARFRQSRSSALFREDIVTSGTVRIEGGTTLLWETESPEKRSYRLEDLASNRRYAAIGKPENFSITAERLQDGSYSLHLLPLKRDLKQLFRDILVAVASDGRIREVRLTERNGDVSQLSFTPLP